MLNQFAVKNEQSHIVKVLLHFVLNGIQILIFSIPPQQKQPQPQDQQQQQQPQRQQRLSPGADNDVKRAGDSGKNEDLRAEEKGADAKADEAEKALGGAEEEKEAKAEAEVNGGGANQWGNESGRTAGKQGCLR